MRSLLVAISLLLLASLSAADFYFPPSNGVAQCTDPSVQNRTLYYDLLESSTQMPAQVVAMRVGVPFSTLVDFFNQPSYWPVWNHLFGTNFVTDYTPCAPFNNVTYTNPPPVVPPFPTGMTAPHWIDQHAYNGKKDEFAFGWIFQLVDPAKGMIIFGRHTFTIRKYVDQSGVDASTVESFEKAAGPQMDTKINQVAWTLALQESLLDGAKGFSCLELVYTAFGELNIQNVTAMCGPKPPAPPSPPTTKPFTQVQCTDTNCSVGCKSVEFQQNTCVRLGGSGGSVKAFCKFDFLVQQVFLGSSNCTGTMKENAQPLNTCLISTTGVSFENYCSTTVNEPKYPRTYSRFRDFIQLMGHQEEQVLEETPLLI
jgi:hypothetical protein